ncbi:MAG: hypothetical protein RMM53_13735, partial [Bacteroidia bacterium]|nr:hypothetical protein [Bacteroidia bacterium]
GPKTVTLHVVTGTCTTTVQQTFNVYMENIYKGGPFDGESMGYDGIDASIVANPGEICPMDTVQLSASVVGATVTSWEWSPATGLSATNVPNPKAFPWVTTVYTVKAVVAGGCSPKKATVVVKVKPYGIVPDAGPDYNMCGFYSVKLGTPAQPNGTYSWAPTTGLDNPNTAQPIFSPTATGTYLFTLTVVTAGLECPMKDIVKVVVKPDPNISLGPDKYLCPSQTSTTISVASFPPGTNLQWQPDKISNLDYTLSTYDYRNINQNNTDYWNRFVASSHLNTIWTTAANADGYYGNGWKAAVSDANQWVRYDMGRDTVVVRISTAGTGYVWTCCPWQLHPDSWVTSYQ